MWNYFLTYTFIYEKYMPLQVAKYVAENGNQAVERKFGVSTLLCIF